MNKADWLVLSGYVSIVVGVGMIYRPLAFIAAGLIFILIAKATQARAQRQRRG